MLEKNSAISINKCNIVAICLVFIIGFLLYTSILNSPFQLDDHDLITKNLVLKDIKIVQNIWDYTPRKFITLYTFALNYHFSKNNPFSYHLVNVIIHLINAILVYWLMLLLLRANVNPAYKWQIALIGSLIFLVHPVQTESVTYIWQRATILSATFYLSSIVLYLLGRIKSKRAYFLLSFAVFITGFFAKGDVMTLPLVIILLEISFLNKGYSRIKEKFPVILSLLFLLGLIVIWKFDLLHSLFNKFLLMGSETIPIKVYFLTQLSVVVKYIGLIFVPINQNVDYFFKLSHSFFELRTFFSFLTILFIILSSIYMFKKNRLMAFGVWWFFITLIPTSSIFPLDTVIFEHRLYLPLVGFSIFLPVLIYNIIPREFLPNAILALIISIFCVLTFNRNILWQSETTLLEDTIKKSPLNARPHLQLGAIYYKLGDHDNALLLFKKAIDLSPAYPEPHNNLGLIYLGRGNIEDAKKEFLKAISLKKDYTSPYVNLAQILISEGKYDEAINLLNNSIVYYPTSEAYIGLGNAYMSKKDFDKAEYNFNSALLMIPDNKTANYNLGNLNFEKGAYKKAMGFYKKSIEIDPRFVEPYINMGVAYFKLREFENAKRSFLEAIALNPKRPDVFRNLASTYHALNDDYNAEACIKKVQELQGLVK